ncbi:DUF6221 family protein [Streptomyces sp. NPDC053367]|uniref:DUF6221 family protein n=1 Tax=Streptomyces sp. NPDC053367 TaxID=3365700 RepID=UPI0037CF7F0B
MVDLVRWLGEQLDADEQTARAVKPDPGLAPTDPVEFILAGQDFSSTATEAAERHVRRFADPSRVMREIDAKRQVLADFEESLKRSKEFSRRAKSGEETEVQKQQRHEENIRLLVLLKVVKQLASAYSDREGYAEALASLG